MVGNYRTRFESGSDELTLLEGGTFLEEITFKNGMRATNRGTWKLVDPNHLTLEHVFAIGGSAGPYPRPFVPTEDVHLPIRKGYRGIEFGVDESAVYVKEAG